MLKKFLEMQILKKSNAKWALEWVLNNRNVTCVFSGMNSIEQIDENISIANETTPLSMSFSDLETIELVKRVINDKLKINCSTCGYCMPCPREVNIPGCMKIYNEKYLFNHKGLFNQSVIDYYQYVWGILNKASNAGRCNACGKCLKKCPQKLDIISELNKVKKEFEIPEFNFLLTFMKFIGIPMYNLFLKITNY